MKSLSENFNLSILEIFSVLFPGGAMLLVCMRVPDIQARILAFLPNKDSELQGSLAFLGAAYFIGYVLFYISSFLDTPVYDRMKAERKTLTDKVIDYKTKAFGYDNKTEINAFKWSCAVLLAQQPAMYAAVERFMAASKFFRSMIVVFCLAALIFICQGHIVLSIVAVAFAVISLFNYIRQRDKAVEAAYHYVITIQNF